MKNPGGRRTARRIATTGLGVVAAGTFIAPGIAHAEPTQDEVEDRIEELNQEAATAVETFNQAEEDYEAAKAAFDELDGQVGDEQERYDELREKVQQFANATYQGGELNSTANVLTSDGPEALLEQNADLNYLSENQQAQLDDFGESAERLFALKDEAEKALEEAEEAKNEAEEAKEEVEEAIEEQQEILSQFPDSDASAEGGDDSAGQTPDAPVGSGGASAALDFAYAQVGKPYIWGGTGPNGYDCSGLVQASWRAGGVDLPRTTYGQADVGTRIYDMSAVQPGDILFFFGDLGHNGLYAGNGQMVHAPRSGRNLEVVGLAAYWGGQFQFAVRP
ncbi:NlpC/P60 family protein [Nocardiopsis exhalans]|uniref:Cell wall-associated NlpC family hydrolase n=2 Tax=Nocardiopsis TaxID=2013 RepID=A0A840W8Q3_9ACTN|nr:MULTISPECIES: NlpC/P60 family protein [Nocardiopsis]MBB5491753.1 cell wall-associated NlpC family hydrolase [Nocardiopsis metallicus]USY18282.1 NlpC/P60 family protein [Nocardiopsis exhalans]